MHFITVFNVSFLLQRNLIKHNVFFFFRCPVPAINTLPEKPREHIEEDEYKIPSFYPVSLTSQSKVKPHVR